MRDHESIVQEMDRQGQYLHSLLRADKLNKLTWLEFRHMVKVMDRLLVNVTDFNATHFGPLGADRRKRIQNATRARRGSMKIQFRT